jgi:hypothetical protein
MGASLYSRIVLIVVCALSVAGCSSSSDESYSSESKTIEDINWIKTCEADYNSSDCDEAILKMIQKQEDVSLYAVMEPYDDPEKTAACLEDPNSNVCGGTRILSKHQMTDLTCEPVEAFGFGYFCYAKLILWNKGNVPIDDFIEASIYDNEGRKFAADVNGNFNFGLSDIKFSDSFKIDLNPGKFEFVHFGFSIPSKDTVFTRLVVGGYDSSFDIPLCLKTRGIEYDKNKIKIFENSRLLNSCTFNWDKFAYESRSVA